MQSIDGKRIITVIPTSFVEEIDRIAKRQGKTRSETIRLLLGFGVDVYTDFERIGAVRLVEAFDKAKKCIKKGAGQQSLFL